MRNFDTPLYGTDGIDEDEPIGLGDYQTSAFAWHNGSNWLMAGPYHLVAAGAGIKTVRCSDRHIDPEQRRGGVVPTWSLGDLGSGV